MENFKKINWLMFENIIPFSMYRSTKTGITVCIAEVNGPIITAYFNIVTETFDNDGLPYAVKHLIFTGSRDYPYNDILKLWTNKSLESNITACASQQYTYFTMSAASSDGFLNLMPIYLDHILYPTLEDSAYLTEVHHINGEGYNDGVVYRNTQKKEHTSHHIIEKKVLQALYPEDCGYNSVIYGTTKNLRESTNNEKVKQFHEKFYQPENLTILIIGKIQHHNIFVALLPLEQKIMLEKRKYIFKRSWQTPIKPLENSVEDVEVFLPTSYKKTCSEVCIAWRKPSVITQMYDYRGCLLLLEYLMKTTSCPLLQEFLKIHDTCYFTWSSWKDSSEPYLQITLKNVPVEKCDLITKQFIHKVISKICTEGIIDMEIMKRIIQESILDYRIDLEENNLHDTINSFLINHIIYNNTDKLDQSFNYIRDLENLKNEPEEHFLDLLKKYFIDAPMVVVKCIPSLDENVKLHEKEVKRIKEQIKQLGKGLNQKKKELNEAIEKINLPVPEEVLAKISIPFPNSITYHTFDRFNTETKWQNLTLDVKQLPFFTYLDDVDSNLFYLQVVMDASSISAENRFYIPLLVNVITQSPVKRGNQLLVYKNLKNALFADTVKVTSYIGINTAGDIAHSISLLFQVELHNYEKSIKWCKKILYDTELTAESLKTSITQILDNIDKVKVQGKHLVEILLDILLYTNDNHKFTHNILRQHKFLNDIQERLNTDVGQKEVMAEIESVRQTLTSPKNMFVYMAVNVDKLTKQFPDVYAPWKMFFSNFMNLEKTKMNITSNWKSFTLSKNFTYNGCIVGLEWINSIFFIQTCLCIKDIQDPDLPALEVCLAYFRQERLWYDSEKRRVLSGHFRIYTTVADGLLSLKFYLDTNMVTVYQTAKNILLMYLTKTKWNEYWYEKAKLSVILNCINNVSSIRRVINTSLTCYCRNVPYDYTYELIRRICAVSTKDMSYVLNKYIKPLFNPKKSKTAIVCNISEVARLKNDFQKMGFNFNVCRSLEELNNYIESVSTK